MKSTFTNKIRAFTLFEVMITMIISGIVISMVSILFLNINKLYLRQKAITDTSDNILELFSAIKSDMQKADMLVETTFGFKIVRPENEIIYEIYEGTITRKIDQRSNKFYFITEDYSVEYLDKRNNILKSVFFNIYLSDALIYPVMIYKDESRRMLFETEISKNIY